MRMRLAAFFLVVIVGVSLAVVYFTNGLDIFGEEVTEYKAPQPKADEELVDDQLSEKNPTFIPDLIDRRPEGGWRINASAAVLRLDVPMLMPDADAALLELRPSYTERDGEGALLDESSPLDQRHRRQGEAVRRRPLRGDRPRLLQGVEASTGKSRDFDQAASRPRRSRQPSIGLSRGRLKIAGVEVKNGQPDQVASWLSRFESDAMVLQTREFLHLERGADAGLSLHAVLPAASA